MRRARSALFGGLALAAGIPWVFASCAATDEGNVNAVDASTILEAAPSDAGADVDEGGCDAADLSCLSPPPVRCEDADFCPVPTNVTTSYALTTVWGSSKTDVWASGSGGTVIHWDGTAWKPTPLPSDSGAPLKNTFHALRGSGPNDVWVASTTNLIFHTDGFKNGTATWVRAPNATEDYTPPGLLYAAWATSPDDVRFVGVPANWEPPGQYLNSNQFVKSASDAGIAWTRLEGTATIHGIWGTSPDDLWLIADNSIYYDWYNGQWVYTDSQVGLTLHGRRSGDDFTWTAVDSRANSVFRGIWGTSANDIWIVGDSGTIRHLGESESAWSVVEAPTTETLHGVWAAAPNDAWAVGESGTILHWDGSAWNRAVAAFPANKRSPHLYGVWGSGPDDVWIVGDGIALHSTGGAK